MDDPDDGDGDWRPGEFDDLDLDGDDFEEEGELDEDGNLIVD